MSFLVAEQSGYYLNKIIWTSSKNAHLVKNMKDLLAIQGESEKQHCVFIQNEEKGKLS